MDNFLKSLFDYQMFEEQKDLQSVIDSVHARYTMKELTADDLGYVAAAGAPESFRKDKKQER